MGGLDPLGVFLKERRERLGLSLQQVCRRAGRLGVPLSPSHLLRLERGKMPRADHLAVLCRVLGVPSWQALDLAALSGENAIRVSAEAGAGVRELLAAGDEQVARGRLARARVRFLVARLRAREEGDRPGELAATGRIAWVDLHEGRFAAALLGFAEVLEAEDAYPEDRDAARVRLFRLHVRLGWREQARALAGELREMAVDRRRPALARAGAWCALAVFEERFGDRGEAASCWRAAMRLLARAGHERERVRAALGHVDLLIAGEEWKEAVRLARDLERRTRKAELAGLRPNVLERLGRALVLAGRPEAAVPWLKELAELAADRGDEGRWAAALAWEARARWMLGEEDAARSLLRVIADAADVEGDPETARVIEELRPVVRDPGPVDGPGGGDGATGGQRSARRPRAGGAA